LSVSTWCRCRTRRLSELRAEPALGRTRSRSRRRALTRGDGPSAPGKGQAKHWPASSCGAIGRGGRRRVPGRGRIHQTPDHQSRGRSTSELGGSIVPSPWHNSRNGRRAGRHRDRGRPDRLSGVDRSGSPSESAAAVVLEMCDGTRTVEEIARVVGETFGLSEVPERETEACVEGLSGRGSSPEVPGATRGVQEPPHLLSHHRSGVMADHERARCCRQRLRQGRLVQDLGGGEGQFLSCLATSTCSRAEPRGPPLRPTW